MSVHIVPVPNRAAKAARLIGLAGTNATVFEIKFRPSGRAVKGGQGAAILQACRR